MEDRFKFRVWEVKNNKYRTRCQHLADMTIDIETGLLLYGEGMEIYGDESMSYILEQCTGLKDKNGKLVFEGDILLIKSEVYEHYYSEPVEKEYRHLVRWRENQTGYYPFCYGLHQEYESTTFEVIGNVHENPELLKNEDR